MNRYAGKGAIRTRHRRGVPLTLAAGSALALITGICPASGRVGAYLQVEATVVPVATLALESSPRRLLLSRQDIERGYIDVEQPSRLRVSSNSRRGYELVVLPVNTLFRAVEVHGLDSEVSLGPDGGVIVQRWQRAQSVALSLTYRFVLQPGLVAGRYSWPLQLQVRALDAEP